VGFFFAGTGGFTFTVTAHFGGRFALTGLRLVSETQVQLTRRSGKNRLGRQMNLRLRYQVLGA
jgi:hypothetical protein